MEREREREDLLDDFIWDMETREKKEAEEQRQSRIEAFRQLLQENTITIRTQWRRVFNNPYDNIEHTLIAESFSSFKVQGRGEWRSKV